MIVGTLLKEGVVDWLLEGDAWVRCRTLTDLVEKPDGEAVEGARMDTAMHPQVKALVNEVNRYPWPPIVSHKSAGHPIHKLVFLADLGLTPSELGIVSALQRILESDSEEGLFGLPMKIGQSYGGSGNEEFAWALCDSPLLTYSLIKFGYAGNPKVRNAVRSLVSYARSNGWPCAVSPKLGKFRGPGRKADPCPYANLIMLKLLAQLPELRGSEPARAGAESALELWLESKIRHPYMFYMGTDFRKLKAPFVWYDILHVAEVLTQFPWLIGDERLGEMTRLIASKADKDGRFTPESTWMAWKGWDFCQKKQPSKWLTLVAHRILNRSDPGLRKGSTEA